jgi:hypothetical protein
MPTAAPPRSQATAGTSQATGQLTGEQMALILAMIAATSAAQDNLATRTVGAIQRLYSELLEGNGWFTQRRVDEIVRDVTEVMEDSLQAAGEITQGYLEGVLDVLDVDFDDIDITIDPAIRTGVTPEREWNRPAEQARISRLLGADSGDIVAYRRILHPELSQSGPCGLCIVAASRVYHKSDLRPLHNGCWCDVMPVVKTGSGEILDPGFDLNEDDLKALYGAEIRSGRLGPQTQSGTGRQGLQRVRLKHLQHAELGPVLVDGRYAIRKKADVVDLESKRMDPQRIYDAQVKIIADYERRVAAGQRPQFDIDFHRRIRDEYAKKLGIKADAA